MSKGREEKGGGGEEKMSGEKEARWGGVVGQSWNDIILR